MHKKIFISEEGILGLEKVNENDVLASSYDLLEDLCMGNKEFLGVLELSDGIFTFFSNLDDKESIRSVGELCEYIKIGENIIVKETPTIIKNTDINCKRVITGNLLVASLVICILISYVM